jgi:hypothetical protein
MSCKRTALACLTLLLSLTLIAMLRPRPRNMNVHLTGNIDDPDSLFWTFDHDIQRWVQRLDALHRDPDSVKIYDKTGKLTAALSVLHDISQGLEQMKGSKVKFRLFYAPDVNAQHGYTTVNDVTGVVEMRFHEGSRGQEVVGHEIIHGIQYLNGEISVRRPLKFENGQALAENYGSLYDIKDETQAFRWARLKEDYLTVDDSWNDDTTRSKDPAFYGALPRKAIGLHSRTGRALRKRTYQEGLHNQPNSEFYIHWEKEYLKGCKTFVESDSGKASYNNSPCILILQRLHAPPATTSSPSRSR